MKNKNCKTKKQGPRGRYNLGSFVENNSKAVQGINTQLAGIGQPQGGNVLSNTTSMLGTGASIGTAFAPGIGTAIGAGVGALAGVVTGLFKNNKEKKAINRQNSLLNETRHNLTEDAYNSTIDTYNQDEYGVYAKGGTVEENVITVEKGELQVDPTKGKILREYTGINPETGGQYENHSKKGKDTKHNDVTAEPGTFIITKKMASKYKAAVENNDTFYKNAIMANIRNHKEKQKSNGKYALGSFVNDPIKSNVIDPVDVVRPNRNASLNMAGVNPTMSINPNLTPTIPTTLSPLPPTQAVNPTSTGGGINWGNIAQAAVDFAPAAYNIFQGSRSANTLPYNVARMNVGQRQQILNNLPREMSANPALNNLRRSRRNAYGAINNIVSNPAINRANKLALESDFIGRENEILYNNQLTNNQIRSQRAGILSGLESQDFARSQYNNQVLNNTMLENRRIQQAKQQQFDYGISQAQQMYQTRNANRQKGNMQERELEILRQVFPALGKYYPQLGRSVR